MKVLAERSNKIFVVGPIIMGLCAILIALIANRVLPFRRRIRGRIMGGAVIVFLSMAFAFVERLCMPKVLIEYDDCGLYIYKYRKSEPIIVRYEQITGHRFEVQQGSEDFPIFGMSQEQIGFISKDITGALCIHADGTEVHIRGIKDIKNVKIEFNRILRDFKNRQNEEIDELIERSRRKKELEELAKHDINT